MKICSKKPCIFNLIKLVQLFVVNILLEFYNTYYMQFCGLYITRTKCKVPTVVGCIMIDGALTHVLCHSICDLKAAWNECAT